MTALKIDRNSYKIGLDEIQGLEKAMTEVLNPVLESVTDRVYWSDDLKFESTEYRSRDGFMAYSSNCGGMELLVIVPKCEEYSFKFLEFGECDDKECDHEQECGYESEGHLDAKLRVWLKLEPMTGDTMNFYLVLSGGNGDAPYFREKASSTYFESEFSAKTIAEFKKKAKSEIAKLLKVIE